jgi:hypothetical protein
MLTARERIQQQRQKIAANRSKGLKPYKWKGGTTSFRILPALDTAATPTNSGAFSRRYGKTYLKSFDGQNFFGIGDRDITYGESDPIKELIFDAMRQAPDPETRDHYRKMLSSPREIFCALILDDKDQSPTEPVLIEVSEGAFDGILSQFEAWTDEDPDYDIASLSNGHVFKCEKTGTGMDTKYTFTVTPKKAPLDAKILEKAIDLDAWIASQFEGLEQKALEFLGRLNGAAGIPMSANLLSAASQPRIASSNTVGSAQSAGATSNSSISPAAVTEILDDIDDEVPFLEPVEADIEDAVVEAVVEEPTPVAEPEPVAAPEPEPVASPVTAPAASDEIDDILASLQ